MSADKSSTQPSASPGAIVIRSDTEGLITQVNDALLERCNFSREELIGQHLGQICQPEGPGATLVQLIDQLKQGLPWSGLVKNQCKDGKHFWSNAQIVPVRKEGTITGYLLVCTGPVAEQEAGSGPQTTTSTNRTWQRLLSVKVGVIFGVCLVILMLLAAGWLGTSGLRESNQATKSIYHEALEPIRTIGRIIFLMADNRAQVALAMHHNPVFHHPGEFDHDVRHHIDTIEKNRLEINQLRDKYRNSLAEGEHRTLVNDYFKARESYVEDGLKPAMQALGEGDFYEAEQLLLHKVHPLYIKANQLGEELLQQLTAQADARFRQIQSSNESADHLFHIGVGLGILIISLFGAFFFYATVLPLQASIRVLERITEGNLSAADTAAPGFGEPGRVMAAVVVMQVNLRVIIEEIRQRASNIRQQCQRLNHSMMMVAEHSDEQHDRLSIALESIQRASSEFSNLTEGSDALALLTEQSEQRIQTMLETCQTLTEESERITEERVSAFKAILEGNRELTHQAQDLAGTVVLQAFSAEDNASQLAQVAALVQDNRSELQEVWAVSRHLEEEAAELDALVGNFE